MSPSPARVRAGSVRAGKVRTGAPVRALLLAAGLSAMVGVPGAAASAQERPPTVPTRDVDVTYRMVQPPGGAPSQSEGAGQGAAAPLEQRMRWLVAEQLLRVDPPTRGLWILVDYRGRRMSLVQEEGRRVLDMEGAASPLPAMPGGAGSGPGTGPGAAQAFVRRGADQVAGVPCTEWQTADTGGQPTLACITADGVLLRARQAGRTLVEAQRVQYAPQDVAAFRTPPGYQHVQAPQPGQAASQGAAGGAGRSPNR